MRLIRTLGLRRVHLVGFDFGGPTAVMVCAQAPELVAGLTLAATNVLKDRHSASASASSGHRWSGPSADSFRANGTHHDVVCRGRATRSISSRRLSRDAAVSPGCRRRPGVSSRRVCATCPASTGPYKPPSAGSECRAPWCGATRTPFFPTAVGERTAAHIPGARFVQLKGCGHFLPAEDPGGFAAGGGGRRLARARSCHDS